MQLYCYKILIVHVVHSYKKINYTAGSTLVNRCMPKLSINLTLLVLIKFKVVKSVQRQSPGWPQHLLCVLRNGPKLNSSYLSFIVIAFGRVIVQKVRENIS